MQPLLHAISRHSTRHRIRCSIPRITPRQGHSQTSKNGLHHQSTQTSPSASLRTQSEPISPQVLTNSQHNPQHSPQHGTLTLPLMTSIFCATVTTVTAHHLNINHQFHNPITDSGFNRSLVPNLPPSSSSSSSSSSSLFSKLLSCLPVDDIPLFPSFPIAYSEGLRYGYIQPRSGLLSWNRPSFDVGGLQTNRWLEYPIIQNNQLTPTRYMYMFQLPDDNAPLLMPASSFVLLRMKKKPQTALTKNNPGFVPVSYSRNPDPDQLQKQNKEDDTLYSSLQSPNSGAYNPNKPHTKQDYTKNAPDLSAVERATRQGPRQRPDTDDWIYAVKFPMYDTMMGEFGILGDHDRKGQDPFNRLWRYYNVGDCIEMMGPFYTDFSYRPHTFDEIIMLVGGPDGLGPMMQVYRSIWENQNDHTRVHIVYCNKDADRALFQEQLNAPRNTRSTKQFVITNMLEQKGGETHGGTVGDDGKVDPESVESYEFTTAASDFAKGFIENTHYGLLTKYKLHRLIGNRDQTVVQHNEKRKILVAGPPGFVEPICGLKNEDGTQGELTGWLHELGYRGYEVTKF